MRWVKIDWENFETEIKEVVKEYSVALNEYDGITGPGRSGAFVACFCSHLLSKPYIPWKNPSNLGRILIVDTAFQKGKTMTKAVNAYQTTGLTFWNESKFRLSFPWEQKEGILDDRYVLAEPKFWSPKNNLTRK